MDSFELLLSPGAHEGIVEPAQRPSATSELRTEDLLVFTPPADEAEEERSDDGGEADGGGDAVVVDESHKKTAKGQYFVFTQNLGKDEAAARTSVESFRNGLERMKIQREISFITVGHEIAPRTGEHHLQGYLEVFGGKRITFATFKKFICFKGLKPVWVASARGSALQNEDYTGKAKKEGRYYEKWGEFRNYGQGKSKEMVQVQKKLDLRVPIGTIYKEHFDVSAKHYRFFKEYQSATRPQRAEPSQVFYIYGPSGTGKSKYCFETWGHDPTEVYWLPLQKAGGNVWWDGYQGQPVVIIDDWYPGYFGAGHVAFMLRLVDRYPFQVPVHGGQVEFRSKTIVFTSNTPIDEIDNEKYSGYPWDITNPLFNRVYIREPKWIVRHMAAPPPPPPPAPRMLITTLAGSAASQAAAEREIDRRKSSWLEAKRRRISRFQEIEKGLHE